jgi:hypothetical protein
MANCWGISKEVENIVQERDIKCVYCNIEFSNISRKHKATWEHIINDIRINNSDNIALCCCSCNASKGNKKLEDWLESSYCKSKLISKETVAIVVKEYLTKNNI